MQQQPQTQAEPVELTKSMRAAFRQDEAANVFRAAGATEIKGQAAEVLVETTAAHVAGLLAKRRYGAPANAQEPPAKLVESARKAFDLAKLDPAFKAAGIDPKQGQDVAAREMARIAHSANDFARSERRAVCHNCTAIGAARAAAAFGPEPSRK